jgi:hypothetical protein
MMLLTTSLLLALTSYAAPPAAPVPANCLDMAAVRDVEEHFSLPDFEKPLDRCDATSPKFKLLESLALIKTIQFDAQNKPAAPLNSDVLPTDFWGYFSLRANQIVNEPATQDSCAHGFMAFVYGAMNDGTVHLCPVFYDASQTVYDRASTMLHEVRHFAGYSHVTCTRGPESGRAGSCDTSIALKGSYAVTVESITKMALLAKNLSPATRFMLKTTAISWIDSSFNQAVLPHGFTSIYLNGADGKGYFFDGHSVTDGPYFPNARVVSRQSSLSIFPNDKSDVFTFDYFSAKFDHFPAMGSMAISYNKIPQANRPAFVDVINAGHLTGWVSDQSVTAALIPSTSFNTVTLDSPARAVFTAAELGLALSDSYYVLTEKNEMHKVEFKDANVHTDTLVPDASTGFQSFSMLGDDRLGLTNDGQVVSHAANGWQPLAPLAGKKITLMSRPFYWTEYFMPKPAAALALRRIARPN